MPLRRAAQKARIVNSSSRNAANAVEREGVRMRIDPVLREDRPMWASALANGKELVYKGGPAPTEETVTALRRLDLDGFQLREPTAERVFGLLRQATGRTIKRCASVAVLLWPCGNAPSPDKSLCRDLSTSCCVIPPTPQPFLARLGHSQFRFSRRSMCCDTASRSASKAAGFVK